MHSALGISSRRVCSKLVRSHSQPNSVGNSFPATQVHLPSWLQMHSASSSKDSSFSASGDGAHLQQRQVFAFPVEIQIGTCYGYMDVYSAVLPRMLSLNIPVCTCTSCFWHRSQLLPEFPAGFLFPINIPLCWVVFPYFHFFPVLHCPFRFREISDYYPSGLDLDNYKYFRLPSQPGA